MIFIWSLAQFCKRKKEIESCNWCFPNICNSVRWTLSKDCKPLEKIIKEIIMDGKEMKKIYIYTYFWACWSWLTISELYVSLATRLRLQSWYRKHSPPPTTFPPPFLSPPPLTVPLLYSLTSNLNPVLLRFSKAQSQIIKRNLGSCGHYSWWEEQT